MRAIAGAVLFALLSGCSPDRSAEPDVAFASPQARADYAVFAVRCSQCHSLARPLNSGIDDDAYWKAYVARMRRQPGSGISAEDAVAILRFLHVYSLELRRKKQQPLDPPDASQADPGTAAMGAP